MNFSPKFTLALATASILCPIAAYAGPTTGSTAAAVSIKFQDCKCGPTSGNFTINPGSTANGSGTGVQELSAAVATGETKAEAKAGTISGERGERGDNKPGTNASAKGFSQPVTFSYVSTSDISKKYDTSDVVNYSTRQENESNTLATTTKNSNYDNYSKVTGSDVKKGESSASDVKKGETTASDVKKGETTASDVKKGETTASDVKSGTDSNSNGSSTGTGSSSTASSKINDGDSSTNNGTVGTGTSGATTKTTASNVRSGNETSSNVRSSNETSSNVRSGNETSSNVRSNNETSSNVRSSNLNTSKGGSNDNTYKSDVNSQEGATTNNTSKTTNLLDTNNTKVEYNYTGSAAGLSYIPIIK